MIRIPSRLNVEVKIKKKKVLVFVDSMFCYNLFWFLKSYYELCIVV